MTCPALHSKRLDPIQPLQSFFQDGQLPVVQRILLELELSLFSPASFVGRSADIEALAYEDSDLKTISTY
jgi:hypothetical protein